MLNCRTVSEFLSKDEIREALLWTRIAVKMHLVMCCYCSRFARQLVQIRTVLRESFSEQEADPDLESRIVQTLQRESRD